MIFFNSKINIQKTYVQEETSSISKLNDYFF